MSTELSSLKNIGSTVEKRLNEIGIRSREDLERVGSVAAYRKICARYPEQTIPVCYYLYSLEGALMDTHWDALPFDIKDRLYAQAKGQERKKRR